MAKAVTDILRNQRRNAMAAALEHERAADYFRDEEAKAMAMARECREIHAECGVAIVRLDGTDAPLDFPERPIVQQSTNG